MLLKNKCSQNSNHLAEKNCYKEPPKTTSQDLKNVALLKSKNLFRPKQNIFGIMWVDKWFYSIANYGMYNSNLYNTKHFQHCNTRKVIQNSKISLKVQQDRQSYLVTKSK